MRSLHLIIWVSWNLLLAGIPVALAVLIRDTWALAKGKRLYRMALPLLVLVWLLFLPNTCYLLTEWRHFFDTLEAVQLYTRWNEFGERWALEQLILRSLFFFTYSALGMLAFTLAIRPLADIARRVSRAAWAWGMVLFPLVSLGVYLGLVHRFNSWEVLNRPERITDVILTSVTRADLFPFLIGFAGFLWLAYFLLDIWVDGVKCRLQRRKPEKPIVPPAA